MTGSEGAAGTRLLFVSPAASERPRGGRAMLGRVHRDTLRDMLKGGFAEHRLSGAAGTLRRLGGWIDGATPATIQQLNEAIDTHQASSLWLDGSNLGRVAQAIRRARPKVRILTFCHNVEARFFWGALRNRPAPPAAGVLAANWIAERLAVRHSDALIALNARDQAVFERLYGRAATDLLPLAMADQLDDAAGDERLVADDAPLLFVGGGFYANRAGILWFAEQVAPRIGLRTRVIGQGMGALAESIGRHPNIELIGAVDRLAPHYAAARAVVAPIFDGSGMKTKVAEALMHGKPIIGTAEAFTGYERVATQAGWLCRDADGFVAAVAEAQVRPIKALDPSLRAIYDRDHSEGAARRGIADILARFT